MPTFPTPEPITLRLKLNSGEAHISAGPRTETEVEVLPSNPSNSRDVETAQHTAVEHRDGVVVVEAPDDRSFGRTGSITVRVSFPDGSAVRGSVASADVGADGRLGAVELHSASGDLRIDHAGDVTIQTASGDVFCRQVDGDAKVQTASGDLQIATVAGRAQLSTASGDARLDDVGGDLRLQAASGDLQVGTIGGSVDAKTASGDVRIGSVRQGEASVDAASGDIQVGIAAGTAAWLDLSSLSGDVSSALDQADEPDDSELTVSVRARTLSGDISIVRAR
ncbi:DUF4097 family beta strand repeat-containing protein [Actinopolymorpha sp. B9G3]|uniref:DUF4097 family beta strand repeat-containing protein n=1 Tax=Actinopolymorpha sp. B9G3 TaxID=3158970 RepID=UPI0032D90D0F